MAQFLQIPAKDKLVLFAGFVQSRNHGLSKRVISFVSRLNGQGGAQKL
jgi:hypothetical protein